MADKDEAKVEQNKVDPRIRCGRCHVKYTRDRYHSKRNGDPSKQCKRCTTIMRSYRKKHKKEKKDEKKDEDKDEKPEDGIKRVDMRSRIIDCQRTDINELKKQVKDLTGWLDTATQTMVDLKKENMLLDARCKALYDITGKLTKAPPSYSS